MKSSRLTSFVSFAAAFVAAGVAYASRDTPLILGLLALLSTALIGLGWRAGGRARADGLNESSISTLVFPPESKFQASLRHPR
jgi:hypothetical protein